MTNFYAATVQFILNGKSARKVLLVKSSHNNSAYDKAKAIMRKKGATNINRYSVIKVSPATPVSAFV